MWFVMLCLIIYASYLQIKVFKVKLIKNRLEDKVQAIWLRPSGMKAGDYKVLSKEIEKL